MAKKQRGKTTSSSKTTDSKQLTEDFNLMLESSDDEAPEEVTFEDSKAQALRSMKQALDTARREKELLKEKRRKRQELFQEQKKRKLLPADVLEEINSASSKKQKQSEDEGANVGIVPAAGGRGFPPIQIVRTRKLQDDKSSCLNPLFLVTTCKLHSVAEVCKDHYLSQFELCYINVPARPSEVSPPGIPATETTAIFTAFGLTFSSFSVQMYSHIPLLSDNELLSIQNKKGRNKGAAVQFVKKDWASKEKAKAEKLKKRWIHKQQIPSC
ncbi:Nucleolar protein 7 Nucleolar protein of 27 kDa [Channa argus]|uniref:Nucleolar protein 7 Nucleolar protein of 27 kDa n=1 Tax=Channa argus TaxID=215402 RepID=A0A6G1Q7J3_CHAAH|nr:Nucleolar protein 7 Nucleolar protein of 27 kDa [Channa argus]